MAQVPSPVLLTEGFGVLVDRCAGRRTDEGARATGTELEMVRRCFAMLMILGAIGLGLTPFTAAVPATGGEAPKAPALPAIKTIKVLPAELNLQHARDVRKVLVTGVTDGGEVDLTPVAKLSTDSQAVSISADGYISPKTIGNAQVTVSAGGQHTKFMVNVVSAENPPAGFVRDVQPILARLGCNAGTCHGSAKGKEGFKLSLRGYDSDYDYQALINDLGGRRFNRVNPDQSLMLQKPTGAVPHEGGRILSADSDYYKVIRQWIAEGTRREDQSRRATKIEVLPEQVYLALPGMSQQMVVVAHYADGTSRDVTREAVITSSNIEVASAQDNTITALRRGEGAVLVRYEGNYATLQEDEHHVLCLAPAALLGAGSRNAGGLRSL